IRTAMRTEDYTVKMTKIGKSALKRHSGRKTPAPPGVVRTERVLAFYIGPLPERDAATHRGAHQLLPLQVAAQSAARPDQLVEHPGLRAQRHVSGVAKHGDRGRQVDVRRHGHLIETAWLADD